MQPTDDLETMAFPLATGTVSLFPTSMIARSPTYSDCSWVWFLIHHDNSDRVNSSRSIALNFAVEASSRRPHSSSVSICLLSKKKFPTDGTNREVKQQAIFDIGYRMDMNIGTDLTTEPLACSTGSPCTAPAYNTDNLISKTTGSEWRFTVKVDPFVATSQRQTWATCHRIRPNPGVRTRATLHWQHQHRHLLLPEH